jgi:hypothetical protein
VLRCRKQLALRRLVTSRFERLCAARAATDTMDAATMIRLEMARLTKPIGAEIRGIDLRDDLTPSNFSQCWSSFMGQ